MANETHLTILRQGVAAWNQWRADNPQVRPDLSRADLFGILGVKRQGEKRFGRFRRERVQDRLLLKGDETDLSGINLADAEMWGAFCEDVDFRGADFRGAELHGANLRRANLTGARLQGADLYEVDLYHASLHGADLQGARLTRARLVDTNLTGANLEDCNVYGAAVWNVSLDEDTNQKNLVITDPATPSEPQIAVDDIEVAQFVYLLLNHEKLRKVVNSVTERGVLLLGRFGDGGLDVLRAVAAELRKRHYLPIVFDFDRPADRNYTETVKTLAGLSRFVIVDLSGPSVPQELYATVPHLKIPFIPILEGERRQFAMAVDLLEYPWVLDPPVRFADVDDLLGKLPDAVIAPAEQMVESRQAKLHEIFGSG